MTGFLASVRSVDEAMIAIKNGVDIIDLKEPDQGALGAVPFKVMREVVSKVNGERLVSATVGDLPCEPLRVADMVRRVADTGVDLVKVGLFDPLSENVEDLLWAISRQSTKGIIIVAFADQYPGDQIIDSVADAGLAGIMLDTADKNMGSLRQVMNDQKIGQFILNAKKQNLITGLAGSLRQEDIVPLAKHKPDYLGFRGALCDGHQRKTDLDESLLKLICTSIHNEEDGYGEVA
ncbi:MAG: (5-formylfuran-3-yl)methyl phosphate synthase [Gammaproteobacteria bacterium]